MQDADFNPIGLNSLKINQIVTVREHRNAGWRICKNNTDGKIWRDVVRPRTDLPLRILVPRGGFMDYRDKYNKWITDTAFDDEIKSLLQ